MLVLLAAALSTPPSPEWPPLEFRSDVRMIHLDVSAVDRHGRAVAGLRAEDFTVTEDGRRVDVVVFEAIERWEHGAPPGDSPVVVTPPAPPRRIVVLVDTAPMTHAQLIRARESTARYLREAAGAGEWIRLVNLSTGDALDGYLPEDRLRLESAARGLGQRGSIWAEARFSDPIAERVELPGSPSQALTSGQFLSVFAQASDLLGTLESLLVQMQRLPGRKAVVLVSPGFPPLLGLDQRLERVASLAREAATAIYFLDAVGLDGLMPERGRLPPAFETAWQRSGGAQDLAEATGGFVSRFSNSLLPALARVGDEMSTYYVLGYVPPRPDDGRFRSVTVKVKVKGVQARTKRGYLARP